MNLSVRFFRAVKNIDLKEIADCAKEVYTTSLDAAISAAIMTGQLTGVLPMKQPQMIAARAKPSEKKPNL